MLRTGISCSLVSINGYFYSLNSWSIFSWNVRLSGLCYVQVFGKTAVDVLLSQGVLAVSHSSKQVKLYSFEHIVNKVVEALLFFMIVWFIGRVVR